MKLNETASWPLDSKDWFAGTWVRLDIKCTDCGTTIFFDNIVHEEKAKTDLPNL